nr:10593_t:CDS:2 [Entrophospora candida]
MPKIILTFVYRHHIPKNIGIKTFHGAKYQYDDASSNTLSPSL